MAVVRWAQLLAFAAMACSTPMPHQHTDPPPTPCADVDADQDGASACDDCDDSDAAVFPGAVDAWYDGIDANCDGADDSDQDADGDPSIRFGGTDCDDLDPLLSGLNLDHDGLSSCEGDCDDSDSTVTPGGERICDNGLDNDCDGFGDCHPLGLHVLPAPGVPELVRDAAPIHCGCMLPAGQSSGPTMVAGSDLGTAEIYVLPTDWMGTIGTLDAIATLPGIMYAYADVTGDGIPDVVTLGDSFSGPDPIRVYPGPLSGTYQTVDAAIALSPTAGSQGGIKAFDHDGDGMFGVIAVTSRGPENFGAPMELVLYYIPELVNGAGIEAVTAVLYSDTVDGIPVAADGTADLLGNGGADLLVGDLGTYTSYIIEGSALVGNKSFSEAATVTITSCFSPLLAGDLNDDGYPDLRCVPGPGGQGQRILFGPFTSDRDGYLDADVTLLNYISSGLSPGDVDGDGASDLLVSHHDVLLFYGPFPSGSVLDADTAVPDATFATIGLTNVAILGDNNQDGFADFWVGEGDGFYLIHGATSAIY